MQIFVLSRTLNQGTEKKPNSLKMTNTGLDANSLCCSCQSQTYSVLPDKLHLVINRYNWYYSHVFKVGIKGLLYAELS